MKIKLLNSQTDMKSTKHFAKKFTQFGLILSLMVVAAACGGGGDYVQDDYEQRDDNVQINKQSVNVTNGKAEIDCSGSSEGTESTTTVNGQKYRCENGRARKVR